MREQNQGLSSFDIPWEDVGVSCGNDLVEVFSIRMITIFTLVVEKPACRNNGEVVREKVKRIWIRSIKTYNYWCTMPEEIANIPEAKRLVTALALHNADIPNADNINLKTRDQARFLRFAKYLPALLHSRPGDQIDCSNDVNDANDSKEWDRLELIENLFSGPMTYWCLKSPTLLSSETAQKIVQDIHVMFPETFEPFDVEYQKVFQQSLAAYLQ